MESRNAQFSLVGIFLFFCFFSVSSFAGCPGNGPCGQSNFRVISPAPGPVVSSSRMLPGPACSRRGGCGITMGPRSSCSGRRGCGSSSGFQSLGSSGQCRYGSTTDILICADGTFQRDSRGVFSIRLGEGGASGAVNGLDDLGVAPAGSGSVSAAPAGAGSSSVSRAPACSGRGCSSTNPSGENCVFGSDKTTLICTSGNGTRILKMQPSGSYREVSRSNGGPTAPAIAETIDPSLAAVAPASSGSETPVQAESSPGGTHDGGSPSRGASSSSQRVVDPSAAPPELASTAGLDFFRFLRIDKTVPGLKGDCSATGIDFGAGEMDLAGLGKTSKSQPWCLALTAKHCIEGNGELITDQLIDSYFGNEESETTFCSKKGETRGYSIRMKSSIPGQSQTEAIIFKSAKNDQSDLAVMAVPCSPDVKKFKMTEDISPQAVGIYLPQSRGLRAGMSVARRSHTNTLGDSTYFSGNPDAAMWTFPSGATSIPGDSGSPAFVTVNGEQKITGVLHGVVKSGPGGFSGTTIAAGTQMQLGEQGVATANLKSDVISMMDGVQCSKVGKSILAREDTDEPDSPVQNAEATDEEPVSEVADTEPVGDQPEVETASSESEVEATPTPRGRSRGISFDVPASGSDPVAAQVETSQPDTRDVVTAGFGPDFSKFFDNLRAVGNGKTLADVVSESLPPGHGIDDYDFFRVRKSDLGGFLNLDLDTIRRNPLLFSSVDPKLVDGSQVSPGFCSGGGICEMPIQGENGDNSEVILKVEKKSPKTTERSVTPAERRAPASTSPSRVTETASPVVTVLSGGDIKTKVSDFALQSKKPVFVLFTDPVNCPACKEIPRRRAIEAFRKANRDKYEFVEVQPDNSSYPPHRDPNFQSVYRAYGNQGYPTALILANGLEVKAPYNLPPKLQGSTDLREMRFLDALIGTARFR